MRDSSSPRDCVYNSALMCGQLLTMHHSRPTESFALTCKCCVCVCVCEQGRDYFHTAVSSALLLSSFFRPPPTVFFTHLSSSHFSLPYLNFHSSAISAPSSPTSAHIHVLIYITSECPPLLTPGDSYISYRHLYSSPNLLPSRMRFSSLYGRVNVKMNL